MTVIDEIAAERRRQVEVEGWTAIHDDEHDRGELAMAAGWYAINTASHDWSDCVGVDHPKSVANHLFTTGFYRWPWDGMWWKPKGRRRDLIRAAALIVAEIERLDRAKAEGRTER